MTAGAVLTHLTKPFDTSGKSAARSVTRARPAEVGFQGLCLVRLSSHRLQAGRPRQDADPGQQRAGRRAVVAGAPPARRRPRPRHGREDEGTDPAAHVPDSDPGRDRRQADRARNRARAAQGREMLRRRHHPQAQTSGKAEGRQEEDAAVRQGRHPAGSVYCGAEVDS